MTEALNRLSIDAAIARVRNGTVDQEELIDEREAGLRIRIGKRTATWQLVARLKSGARSRIKLGQWPEMGISDARKAARKERTAIDGGEDPNAVERAERHEQAEAAAAEAGTQLNTILEQYEKEVLNAHRTGAATYRALNGKKGLLRSLRKKTIADITRSDISKLIKALAETAPISANRKLAYASAFFNWCIEEEYLSGNPAENIRRPAEENVRDRFHTIDELREIWAAMLKLGYPFSQLYRLLLVMPMRREEIGAMPVAHLTLAPKKPSADDVWLLPGGRTKNGSALRVPISTLARSIIMEALGHEDRPKGSLFVFSTTEETSVSGYSKAKARLDELIDAARRERAAAQGRDYGDADAMPHWTLHDLRTSFNTHACEILGVPPHVADRILNHVATATRSKVMRIYNKSELFEPRREALNAWAKLIETRIITVKPAGRRLKRAA